jgi:hypothetical protein
VAAALREPLKAEVAGGAGASRGGGGGSGSEGRSPQRQRWPVARGRKTKPWSWAARL